METSETRPLLNGEGRPLVTPVGEVHHEHHGFFHPTSTFYRYVVLLFISLICFGSYFSYDEIEGIQPDLQSDLGISAFKFGLLYSIYSFPNMILVFFGGILGDKIGLRLSSMIFVCFVFAGTVIVALAPALKGSVLSGTAVFWVMFIGRLLFGMGSESLNVIQTSMTAQWFKGTTDLAFAMGLTLSMSRLGDFLAVALGATIAHVAGTYKATLWAGAVLCGISFVSTIVYGLLDKPAEKYFNRVVDPTENELNFKAVRYFDVRFWLVSFVCLSFYSGVLPFVAISSAFLHDKYHYSTLKAGWISSIVILASMILSPILGKFLDKVGHRPYFVVLGSLVIVPAHLVLAFTDITPVLPIIFIGLAFSLVPSALWPSVPLLIKDRELATAFGSMTAIQNAGLTATNALAGLIASHYNSYKLSILFFVGMDCIGLILGIVLIIVDAARGKTLCSVSTHHHQHPEPGVINN